MCDDIKETIVVSKESCQINSLIYDLKSIDEQCFTLATFILCDLVQEERLLFDLGYKEVHSIAWNFQISVGIINFKTDDAILFNGKFVYIKGVFNHFMAFA